MAFALKWSEPIPNWQRTSPATDRRPNSSDALPTVNANRLPGTWKRVRESERPLTPTAGHFSKYSGSLNFAFHRLAATITEFIRGQLHAKRGELTFWKLRNRVAGMNPHFPPTADVADNFSCSFPCGASYNRKKRKVCAKRTSIRSILHRLSRSDSTIKDLQNKCRASTPLTHPVVVTLIIEG